MTDNYPSGYDPDREWRMEDERGPELKPCPFCGGKADFGQVENIDSADYSGCYIQCSNVTCEASSALIFPLKEPVRQLLAERWNRRHD